MNRKATLNLPRTSFPMRADLPSSEARLLKFWQDIDLYSLLSTKREDATPFVLHDGPPYASGEIDWNHVLNKILKDLATRLQAMRGHRISFIPGWDCHGLPIELEVEKQFAQNRKDLDDLALRHACREYAAKYAQIQQTQFERLGVLADWQNAYLTMSPAYQAAITRALAELVRSQNLVQQVRPVFWCASCETALAEFEVEYSPRNIVEAYISFPLISDPVIIDRNLRGRNVEIACLIPEVWQLFGITAISIQPSAKYLAIRTNRKIYLVSEALATQVAATCNWTQQSEIMARFAGEILQDLTCRHPLIHRQLRIFGLEALNLHRGTGFAPLIPGHDLGDYKIAKQLNIHIDSPVDDQGRFSMQIDRWAGQGVLDVQQRILRKLQELDALLYTPSEMVMRNQPHCWRCKKPVIFRTTPQWFVPMDEHGLRQRAIQATDQIQWMPNWGALRMHKLLQRRDDWCLSRQRTWGIPLPIFYCKRCRTPLIDPDHIEHLADRYEQEGGADLWFELPIEQLLPPCDGDLRCEKCGHDQFRKERDIVDVWFDSGISAIAVLPASSDKRHAIANLILEGKEQFCGWYQSSILNCLQFKDRIPTQRIITYGRISGEVPVSGDSSCQLLPPNSEIAASEITYATLSKYELALSPQQALQRWGAELMRIWVCSYDLYQTRPPFHLRCTEIAHHYRKVRNCLRFMLGNLYDFKVGEELVAFELLEDIDRYILDILHHKIKSILTAYKEYQFPLVWRTIYEFCLRDLSNFYFDVIKDRLYNSGADWSVRRSSQTALFMIAETLCRLLAPILCFTAEEAWQQLVAKGAKPQSVHLAHLPSLEDIPDASDLCEIWKLLRHTRRQTQLAFNQHRQDIGIMQVKATHTRLYPLTSVLRTAIEYYNPALLAQILGVSQLEVAPREQIAPDRAWRSPLSDLAIDISKASGHICPRCRIVHTESTKNRKNNLCVRCQRATQ